MNSLIGKHVILNICTQIVEREELREFDHKKADFWFKLFP